MYIIPKFHPSLGYQAWDATELVRPPYYRLEAELLRMKEKYAKANFEEPMECPDAALSL